MSPRHPHTVAGLLAIAIAVVAPSCMKRGYPLPLSGRVEITSAVAGSIYATDSIDDAGRPNGPRQQPYQTRIELTISEGGEAAYGAFVFVHVEPAEALTLTPEVDPVSGEETCEVTEGAFRCTATEEGYASFVAASQSDWSGDAEVVVTWADTGEKAQTITIKPAGLPFAATNFDMVTGTPTDRVLATHNALACTTGPIDQQPSAKWREGQIRNVEAFVRASPPSSGPSVIENAPVYVESLSSEGALSLDADCAERSTRLRVLLGATGESPPFRLCFSDLGGPVPFAFSSGEYSGDAAPTPRVIDVSPEPRLLRVTSLIDSLFLGETTTVWEVNAYDANLEVVEMNVDLEVDKSVLKLSSATSTTSADPFNPMLVVADAVGSGSSVLHVRPRLLASPDCASDAVTVE